MENGIEILQKLGFRVVESKFLDPDQIVIIKSEPNKCDLCGEEVEQGHDNWIEHSISCSLIPQDRPPKFERIAFVGSSVLDRMEELFKTEFEKQLKQN
jgi:hypothetical protein